MRIAYVVPSLEGPSGWHSLTCGIVRAMHEHGGIVPLIITGVRDAGVAASLVPDCQIAVVPRTQTLDPASPNGWSTALRTWLRARRGFLPPPDLVHSLEAYPTGLVGHWFSGDRCPHVLTAAGTYAVVWARGRRRRQSYERVLRRAAAVLPISNGTATLMQEHFSAALADVPVRVVLLGSEAHRQVPRHQARDRRPVSPPVVLSVGALKPRKGYHVSLRAFSRLRRDIPDAQYRIVGRVDDSRYRRALDRMIEEERIEGVTFLEHVSDEALHRHYSEASVFLLTPERRDLEFEGFGLVYVEAGAHGLPVVATDSGGVADAVHHETTGLLAQPGNVDQVANYLLQLLRDPDLARRLGRGNRDWAERLTWQRFADEQRGVYEQVMATWRQRFSRG